MNVLEQAKVFANKLNKNQKWILGSLSGLVIVGVVALIVALYEPPETSTLWTNLEASDAARIVEYLRNNKINYELKESGTTIVVPKDRVEELRMTITRENLVQDSYVGYELFDKTNLGMSEFVQQLNGRRALEGELQKTIKSMNEVRDVKVRLVIPKDKLFKADQKDPTASIVLKFKSGHSLSRLNIEGIQNIVASSVEGMDPSKVTVTDNYGRVLSENIPEHNSLAGLSASQLKQQKQLEVYFTDKVQKLLDPAFGEGNSKIGLNTEIDFDQLEVKKKDWDPERQVERSEQTSTDNYTNTDTSFVPGVDEKALKSNEIKNYEISSADSHFIKGIGAVRRLTVTAVVNEKVEIRKTEAGLDTVVSIPRTDEELTRIANAIKNVIGYDERRGDQVNILCVPFVESLAEKITEINEQNRINSIQWYEKENNQRLVLLLFTLLVTAIVMFKVIHAKFARDKMRIAMGLPAKLDKPILEKFEKELIEFPPEDEPEEEDDEDHYEEEVIMEEEVLPELEEEEDEEEEEAEEEDEILDPIKYFDSEEYEDAEPIEEIFDDIEDLIDEIEIQDEDMLMILPDDLEQLMFEGDLLDESDLFGYSVDEGDDIPEQRGEGMSLLDRARAALSAEPDLPMEEIDEQELIKTELRDKVMAFITGETELAIRLFKVFYNQDNEPAA